MTAFSALLDTDAFMLIFEITVIVSEYSDVIVTVLGHKEIQKE